MIRFLAGAARLLVVLMGVGGAAIVAMGLGTGDPAVMGIGAGCIFSTGFFAVAIRGVDLLGQVVANQRELIAAMEKASEAQNK